MCQTENIRADQLRVGDVMFYDGAWWQVDNNYVQPQSCYAKMNLTPFGRPKEIPLSVKFDRSKLIMRKTQMSTAHLHIGSCVEHLTALKDLLMNLDEANSLPERVKLQGSNFEIDSVLIRREAHEKLMAEFHKFKNTMALVKKP